MDRRGDTRPNGGRDGVVDRALPAVGFAALKLLRVPPIDVGLDPAR